MLILYASEVEREAQDFRSIPRGPLLVAMLVVVLDEMRDLHENKQDDNQEQSKGCHHITRDKIYGIGDRKR
jgi:hypothetical protein